MKLPLRRILLFATLAGVVGWSLKLTWPQPSGIQAVRTERDPAKGAARTAAPPSSTQAVARLDMDMQADLFPQQTWVVPPPPSPAPPPPPPPPPPQAPPLPFKFLGAWQKDGRTTYYLQENRQLIGAKEGQVLDGVWRLSQADGTRLDFEYLPLKQTRSLRMGDQVGTNQNISPAAYR